MYKAGFVCFRIAGSIFRVYTYDLQAAMIQTPAVSHSVSSQELHQAVQASSQEAKEARKAVQDFLTRPDIADQISSVGLRPGELAARAQMLSDAEVLLLQQQIMKEDLQAETAAGLTKAGKILTIIGLIIAGAGAVMMFTHWDKDWTEGSGDEGWSIAWKGTGIIWLAVGGALTIIGLTRRK